MSAVSARAAASGAGSASSGSGSQVPGYSSRRTRAERRWSMLSRVVTVVSHALGDSTSSPTVVSRTNASWTMSSASLKLPTMR